MSDNRELDKFQKFINSAKVATTSQLFDLNNESMTEGYNRVMPDTLLEQVDPLGNHLLVAMMIHEHKNGEPCDPHIRAEAVLKMAHQSPREPKCVTIDISIERYNALPTAAEVLSTMED